MPKHFFFDLDDTLTPSRSPMKEELVPLFVQLCTKADVVVISGAQESQMRTQLPKKADGLYYMLTQNGNHALAKDGTLMWSEKFSPDQEQAVYAFIKKVHDDIALSVRDENNLIEHRGSQISYSLIGHNEDREKKKAFDPDARIRIELMKKFSSDIEELRKKGIEVTAAGTTCLDIFLLGKNKGFHVAGLIQKLGWKKDEAIYVGDAIAPGRNDESVIGVIATHSVKDCGDTYHYIQSMVS